MKIKTVRSSWWEGYGYRLDCQPYLAGALETKLILERLPIRKDKLETVTMNGLAGIVNPGRTKRLWVDDPHFGIPFLSGTDILKADLTRLPFISKRSVIENPQLIIRSRWTLITRSGNIGKLAYARAEMDQLACTEDVLRIIPDDMIIPSGYLYAYLSSTFGIPLVVSGTYGAIIQHIEPEHIAQLPVPRLAPNVENRIHVLVEQAALKRTEANVAKRFAISGFQQQSGLPNPKTDSKYPQPFVSAVNVYDLTDRMDASYHSPPNIDARLALSNAGAEVGTKRLGEVAKVFIPGIFKRQYADDPEFGYPYVTGADVFTITPSSNQYLLKSVAEENELVLTNGMILIHEAGQLYGLIGHSVMVGEYLDGFACTNNMVRVVPYDQDDWGFIFALLSSEFGIRLLKREGAGSSIPHLDEGRIQRLEIPWPKPSVRTSISKIAVESINLLDEANRLEAQAQALLISEIERLS